MMVMCCKLNCLTWHETTWDKRRVIKRHTHGRAGKDRYILVRPPNIFLYPEPKRPASKLGPLYKFSIPGNKIIILVYKNTIHVTIILSFVEEKMETAMSIHKYSIQVTYYLRKQFHRPTDVFQRTLHNSKISFPFKRSFLC